MAQEGLDAEGAGEAGGAGGGQGVVGAGQIVAHRFRSPGAQEDGTGVLDALGQGVGIFHQQLQVLRREAIAQEGGLHQVLADHDQTPLLQRLTGDGGAGMILQLLGDRPGHGGRQGLTGGDQDRRRQRIVLRLGHQVGRHLLGAGGVIGDDQHLAGPRQRIDAHPAIDRLLGQRHPQVAGTADHIDARNRFGPEGQRRDRLGATDPIHLLDAGQVGGGQHRGVGQAIGAGRRHHHQSLNARHPRRHGVHQHGARVRGPATGYVQAGPLHRPPATAQPLAIGTGQRQILRQLGLVEGQDPLMGQPQGLLQVGGGRLPGLLQLLDRDAQRIGADAVEAFGQLQQGSVAVASHLLEDAGHAALLLVKPGPVGAGGDRLQALPGRLAAAQHGHRHGLSRGNGWGDAHGRDRGGDRELLRG